MTTGRARDKVDNSARAGSVVAADPSSLRERFAQLACEALLFEVTVGGQRFLNAMPLHEHEAHRVAKGIALVQTLAKEGKRLFMKDTINPDDFQARMDEKAGRETKGRLARDFP